MTTLPKLVRVFLGIHRVRVTILVMLLRNYSGSIVGEWCVNTGREGKDGRLLSMGPRAVGRQLQWDEAGQGEVP